MANDTVSKRIRTLLPDLRRFAFALTASAVEGDDLLQDTVVRLLDKGIPADADAKRWAFRVCKNIWLDQMRAKKVRSTWAQQAAQQDAPVDDGEAKLEGISDVKRVEKLMDEMPGDQRAALAMVALEGASYKETAKALDIPIGTVMSRVARARRYLADRLGPPLEAKAHTDDGGR